MVVLLLVAVGRPVATDDAWWHLAHGLAFARDGPWLDADPLLFTAVRPASTSSWLADVAMAQILARGGFAGLRVAHVACAASVLALAALLLRRESGSGRVMALALSAFATLSAYRIFQLRPDLATLLATLALYALVLCPRAGPSAIRIALCTLGMALWANLHAGFVLGLILVATAIAGVACAAILAGAVPADRARLERLALVGVLAGLATLANPAGFEPHLAYVVSGAQSPTLSIIQDEWLPLSLFAWPAPGPGPSRAEWLLAWALIAGTLAATARAVAGWRTRASNPVHAGIDPALVALAWAALVAMIAASRFLWLGVFPLLLCAQAGATWRPSDRAPRAIGALSAMTGLALLAGFVWIGPWPRISDVLQPTRASYARPYAANKYYADAIWVMRDAGLEGHLFTDYELGGFAGFWLAPDVQTYVNGSLNFPPKVMGAYFAMRKRSGLASGESFPDLLDRFDLDLFLGTGMPDSGPLAPRSTTAHLERTPDWIPIFRNATSALYLRASARNASNLRRMSELYAREGVPFDAARGFEPARVIREQPDWAIRHGLVPANFEQLERDAAREGAPRTRVPALIRTASLHALLGDYDAALEREAELVGLDPQAVGPKRRIVWSLLRTGRRDQARAAAAELEGREDRDGLLRATIALARALPSLAADEAEARIHQLPLLTTAQARALARTLSAPATREP